MFTENVNSYFILTCTSTSHVTIGCLCWRLFRSTKSWWQDKHWHLWLGTAEACSGPMCWKQWAWGRVLWFYTQFASRCHWNWDSLLAVLYFCHVKIPTVFELKDVAVFCAECSRKRIKAISILRERQLQSILFPLMLILFGWMPALYLNAMKSA